jgi:hypothetical protein
MPAIEIILFDIRWPLRRELAISIVDSAVVVVEQTAKLMFLPLAAKVNCIPALLAVEFRGIPA